MDYLNNWPLTTARWGPGPSDTFTMRWYPCSPGAKEYLFPHAFGSTVDTGTFNDSPGMVGEIPPFRFDVQKPPPPYYDGSETPVYNAALEWGADPRVMAVPCQDGVIGLAGSATVGFAPVYGVAAPVCECETVLQ
jgi:hypothetical protein